MDLPSNASPMVLQLRVGLGYRILPQHLHYDCDDILSDTWFARSDLVPIVPRGFRNPPCRRRMGIGEGAGETVQDPTDGELHIK